MTTPEVVADGTQCPAPCSIPAFVGPPSPGDCLVPGAPTSSYCPEPPFQFPDDCPCGFDRGIRWELGPAGCAPPGGAVIFPFVHVVPENAWYLATILRSDFGVGPWNILFEKNSGTCPNGTYQLIEEVTNEPEVQCDLISVGNIEVTAA
jgi:hypothetical protein